MNGINYHKCIQLYGFSFINIFINNSIWHNYDVTQGVIDVIGVVSLSITNVSMEHISISEPSSVISIGSTAVYNTSSRCCDCTEVSTSNGCDADSECEELICEDLQESYCCTNLWDSFCANASAEVCSNEQTVAGTIEITNSQLNDATHDIIRLYSISECDVCTFWFRVDNNELNSVLLNITSAVTIMDSVFSRNKFKEPLIVFMSNLTVINTVFEDNYGNNSTIIDVSTSDGALEISNCIFTDNQDSMAITSINNDVQTNIFNTQFNDPQSLIFLGANLRIDELSVKFNDSVLFGHEYSDNTRYITLSLKDWKPQHVSTKFNLINFDQLNGSVVFEPCEAFNATLFPDTLFAQSSAVLEPYYAQDYSGIGELLRKTVGCDYSDQICYIICRAKLTCFGGNIISNATNFTIIDCIGDSACGTNTITVTKSHNTFIECKDALSCQESTINIVDVENAVIECISTESCINLFIYNNNSPNTTIICYNENSCKDIWIYSTLDSINFHFYNYNEGVHIVLPSTLSEMQLDCDENNAYIPLNGNASKELQLQNMTRDLYSSTYLPCEHISFEFEDTSKPSCIMEYTFGNVEVIHYLELFMYCAPNDLATITGLTCTGTSSPTTDPTEDPTRDPTSDPTIDPTMDPTDDPTENPTIDPTSDPTSDPSMDPTSDPTSNPTLSPTRVPTTDNAYDSYISLEYGLAQLTIANTQKIAKDVLNFTQNIARIIEGGYDQDENLVLSFEDFWVQILNINDQEIEDLSDDPDREIILANSKDELQFGSRILCDEVICNHVIAKYNVETFESFVTTQLQEYFDDSVAVDNANAEINEYLTFLVVAMADSAKSLYPDAEKENKVVFWMLVGICSMLGLLAMAAFLFNKQILPVLPGFSIVDDARWVAVIVFALQFWDFASDVNLCVEIWQRDDVFDNMVILISAIGSTVFVFVPYTANLVIAARVKTIIKNNETAKAWFVENSAIFTILVVITGGCYAALSLISSNIFGLLIMSSGLTLYELKQLSRIKVFGTVILENCPQLMFQALYAYGINEITEAVGIAFFASLLSVMASTLSYLIDQDTDDVKVVEYYLSVENTTNIVASATDIDDIEEKQIPATNPTKGETTNDQVKTLKSGIIATSQENLEITREYTIDTTDRLKFIQRKGCTKALGEEISKLFEIPIKNIEIGSTLVTQKGARTHIVHYVYQKDIELMQIELNKTERSILVTAEFITSQLYAMNQKKTNQIFRRHFKLDNRYHVVYNDYAGTMKRRAMSMKRGSTASEDNNADKNEDTGRSRLLNRMVTQFRLDTRKEIAPVDGKRVSAVLNDYIASFGDNLTDEQKAHTEQILELAKTLRGRGNIETIEEEEFSASFSITQDTTEAVFEEQKVSNNDNFEGTISEAGLSGGEAALVEMVMMEIARSSENEDESDIDTVDGHEE